MLVEAARAGLGIALVPRFFVLNELAVGELLIPCDLPLRNDKGYYLVYPECKQCSPLLMAFEKWLLVTAAKYCENT
jgi:DNA-binding transcriptional LysR family regulator